MARAAIVGAVAAGTSQSVVARISRRPQGSTPYNELFKASNFLMLWLLSFEVAGLQLLHVESNGVSLRLAENPRLKMKALTNTKSMVVSPHRLLGSYQGQHIDRDMGGDLEG